MASTKHIEGMTMHHFFYSGSCYKKGTLEKVRHFSGLVHQNREEADPKAAIEYVLSTQFDLCMYEQCIETYVQIEQFNLVGK